MKTISRFFATLLILIAFGLVPANAQPLARFSSPTNNQTGVSVGTTITIITKWKIDSTCFHANVGDTIPGDTAFQAVLVLPQYVHDSIPDSLWWRMSQAQTYTIVNDTTLSITLGSLTFGTNYIATIKNLRVIDTFHDTLSVPDTITIGFKTAYGTYEISWSSVLDSSGIIRCSDTLRVHFNRPLDSANTPTGPLFEISALNPTNDFPTSPSDTTIHYFYSDSLVGSTSWVDPSNSNVVCVRGSNLAPGGNYAFHEWVSRLTGDSTQNRYYTLNVKSSYEVKLSTSGISADSTYTNRAIFSPGVYKLLPGDTGKWIAPSIADSFVFSHWSCPSQSSIDGRTNDSLSLTASCASLQDLNITAVYSLLPMDTISLDSIPSRDSIFIYTPLGTLIKKVGVASMCPIREFGTVVITAKADSGYIFDHWNSSNVGINGLSLPSIVIRVNWNFWLTPVFRLITGGTGDFSLGGQVITTDPGLILTTGVAEIIAPGPAGLGSNYYPSSTTQLHNQPVTLQIWMVHYGGSPYQAAGSYLDIGLWQTTTMNHGGTSLNPAAPLTVQNVGTTVTTNHDYDSPQYPLITYDVHRFDVTLQVEIAMSDSSQPPPSLGLLVNGPTNQTGDVSVFLTSNQNPAQAPTPWSPTTFEYKNVLTFKAGVNVQLTAATSADYEFVGWSTDAGYSFPSPSTNENWGSTEIHGDGTQIKAKAIFRHKFTLLTIAVNQDPTYAGSSRNFVWGADHAPVTGWSEDEKEIWLNSTATYGGNNTVELTFKFNDAVDSTTLWKNMECVEQQNRIDGFGPITYLLDASSTNKWLSPDGKTLTWDVASKPGNIINFVLGPILLPIPSWTWMTIPKLQKISIQLTSGLQSTSHVPLSNPTTGSGGYIGETINPDVSWKVSNTQVNDFDESVYIYPWWGGRWRITTDHDCSCFVVTSGSFAQLTGASGSGSTSSGSHSSLQTEPEWELMTGTSHAFNTPITSFTRPRDVSVLSGSVTTMDQDGMDVAIAIETGGLAAIKTAADATANMMLQKLITSGTGAFDSALVNGVGAAAGIAGWEASLGVLAIAAVLNLTSWAFTNSDDVIAVSSWVGTKANWWGALLPLSQTNSYGSESGMGSTTTTIKVTLK